MDITEKMLLVEAVWTAIYLLINPSLPVEFQGSWTVVSMIIMFTGIPKVATKEVNEK